MAKRILKYTTDWARLACIFLLKWWCVLCTFCHVAIEVSYGPWQTWTTAEYKCLFWKKRSCRHDNILDTQVQGGLLNYTRCIRVVISSQLTQWYTLPLISPLRLDCSNYTGIYFKIVPQQTDLACSHHEKMKENAQWCNSLSQQHNFRYSFILISQLNSCAFTDVCKREVAMLCIAIAKATADMASHLSLSALIQTLLLINASVLIELLYVAVILQRCWEGW